MRGGTEAGGSGVEALALSQGQPLLLEHCFIQKNAIYLSFLVVFPASVSFAQKCSCSVFIFIVSSITCWEGVLSPGHLLERECMSVSQQHLCLCVGVCMWPYVYIL